MGNMQMNRLSHWLHRRLLLLLVVAYVAAAFLPALGLEIRKINFGNLAGSVAFTIPTFLLSFLLFNAGLGVKRSALRNWRQSTLPLKVGTLANMLVPAA